MTSRLLPDKDLIALLCRRCHGESMTDLAKFYSLTEFQVSNIFVTHRETYRNMKVFLGRVPAGQGYFRPTLAVGLWKNCKTCEHEIWTTRPGAAKCHRCRYRVDCKRGTGTDYTTTAWRGAG